MRTIRLTIIASAFFILTGMLAAQTTPAPVPPAPAAPAPPPPDPGPLHQAGTDITLTLDGYADKNWNNPPSGYNGLRNFDYRSNTAHINMGQITFDHAPSPVGFRLDVGFGQTFYNIHSADRATQSFEGYRYFKQAYIAFKPKSLKGLQVDVGEFVTSAGAEVIDTAANWNYSRSILFAWAIPYYHFGVRTSFPVGSHFTGGFQVVQGWNNIYDNNKGKTFGFTGAYAWKKATWSNVYYVGQEKTNSSGVRHLYDTTIALNPTDKMSYYINFDYGRDSIPKASAAQWAGIAAAARFALGSKAAFAPRVEYFKDIDGFSTGTTQALKEITLTGEYKLTPWLISRLEFRNDWSDVAFFEKKGSPGETSQRTVLFGLIFYLAPKK